MKKCMEHTWTRGRMNDLFERCRWCGETRNLGSEAPSSPVETTGAALGTTSYTGVIRPADEARVTKWADLILIATGCGAISEVNTRSLMGIADAEHAALTAEVERLAQRNLKQALTINRYQSIWDRLRAELAERDATIERMGKVGSDTINLLTKERGEVNQAVCPDSCGGESWTGVNTSRGRRWRCDTCGRVISRYISDAIQAADDRRSL